MARGWVMVTMASAAAAAAATVAAAAKKTCTPAPGVVLVQAEDGGAPADGWAAVAKAGADGVVWRPDAADGTASDQPGQGRRTYGWTAPAAGTYRLVLRASGVRRWAHHDFYVGLGAGASRLYPRGYRQRFTTRMWRVVYQNSGDDEWAYGGKSDGGVLLTRKLASGEEYTFSLAGRAPLAAVDTLVFYACDPADGESCQDGSAAYKAAVAAAAATDADCRSASGDDSSDGGGDKSDGGAGSTGCALAGGDGGVVPATAGLPPADGWEVADIAGGAGLVWRPNDAAGSPSEAGTGRRDYTWTVPADGGTFRLVLRAAGVQPWKHHDFYVNLGAGARRVYPKGWVQRFPDARWLHVYQNNGDSAWAYGAKSNGGVLVTRPLDGGETLAWSLSGSSPLAAVDHFLWYRCATTDGSCQDGSDAYDAAVAAAPAAAAACAGGGVVGATPVPAPTPTPASAPTPTPTPVPVVIDATPTPAPTPAAPPATGSACAVYAGALGVVRMPAAATGGGDGWEVQTVAGRNALIFRPDKEATSIDAPGAAGVRTFSFAPDEAGSYRVVLRMNAPHPTDYNDVWMKLGAGAKKFQGSTVSSLTASYFKVYQNKGQREWMVGGKNVDFNGHDLLTRPLSAGEKFTVTLSGRSSKIAIADVLLLLCDPTSGSCGGGSEYWTRALGMAPSTCA